ncbi:MAG: hypothetical protein IRZ16_06590 [Myxococcaceae bacterium]|nr:hypothetical protein [Myxococcaceae bacterium]
MGLFLVSGIVSPALVMMTTWSGAFSFELGMLIQPVDVALNLCAWLAVTGALVLVARALRDPARQQVLPAPR